MSIMKVWIPIILVVALIGLVVVVVFRNGATVEETTVVSEDSFRCVDGTEFKTQLLSNDHIVVTLDNVPYELTPAATASGARYANDTQSFVFWDKGDEAIILIDTKVVYEGCRSASAPPVIETGTSTDLISLTSPVPNAVIESPLEITGKARGQWYFEATFPITLTNWDGLIIAEGFATAEGDWMTTEFVPFTAQLEFENPYKSGDPEFMKRGTLILHKSNASGLPEHDAAFEIPVFFDEQLPVSL